MNDFKDEYEEYGDSPSEPVQTTGTILIRDDSFIAVHDTTMISVSWGYFSGFKQSGNGWIKINNSAWEDSILHILELS
jgi:hypothetical protein